jgi:hypothetical protein
LHLLLGDGRLLRAFFYTGVDTGAERQQGFLYGCAETVFGSCKRNSRLFTTARAKRTST